MSKRLQILVPESLDRRIRKTAQRKRMSAGAWVRQTIEAALSDDHAADPLDRLATLGAPTADLDEMLTDIEHGRR